MVAVGIIGGYRGVPFPTGKGLPWQINAVHFLEMRRWLMTRNGSNSCDHTLKRRQHKIGERGLFSAILINSSEISSLNQYCETVAKVPLWLIPTQSGKVLISILQVNDSF